LLLAGLLAILPDPDVIRHAVTGFSD
jgi:hypothetical protein